MSLYGGISFKGAPKPAAEAPAAPAAAAAPPPLADTQQSPAPATPADDKPKPAAWSAALRFAPTTRKKPASTSSRPPVAALRAAFGAVDDDAAVVAPSNAPGSRIAAVGKASLTANPDKAPPPSKWSAVTRTAVDVKPFASSSSTSGASTPAARTGSPAAGGSAPTATRTRRVIAVPPAMVLEDEVGDVNGFAQSAAGKKAAQAERKRGKKRGGEARDDPALAFADVPYDPARPCDYSAYKMHVKLAREQRRLEREEEERRRRREGSASGSSYYSEDDERSKENEPANKKARFFAPPSSYDDLAPSGFPPPSSYGPPSAPSRDETADEAYARRVAMSNPAPPRREETGDEAYARRVALSRGEAPPAPASAARPPAFVSSAAATAAPVPLGPVIGPIQPSIGPVQPSIGPVQPSASMSTTSSIGPVQPSTSRAPPPGVHGFPPPPPGFVPPPGVMPPPPGFLPLGNVIAAAAPQPPPTAGTDTSAPALADEQRPPLAPPLAPLAPSSDAVDAAQAKAREIAARLSKLGGAFSVPPPPLGAPSGLGAAPPGFAPASTASAGGAAGASQAQMGGPPAEFDGRTFAERMMIKFGWEEGKGLGVDESGMTSALSVHRAAPTPSKKAVKKAKALGEAPPPGAGAPKGMAGRSVVVDASREQRDAELRAQMGGDASRVVLLTNLCGRAEVDDDLPGEVAEEANRFGVVERCFVYPVPGEARDDEAVRIFLVMSGLAGGYNAVKNFDGRFFGGRTVRARFYDEKAFHAGRHDL
ncbi:hypothetical protein JCM8208_006938 [Rhodotorula glutinis]